MMPRAKVELQICVYMTEAEADVDVHCISFSWGKENNEVWNAWHWNYWKFNTFCHSCNHKLSSVYF
jgi:hypothetical protein